MKNTEGMKGNERLDNLGLLIGVYFQGQEVCTSMMGDSTG